MLKYWIWGLLFPAGLSAEIVLTGPAEGKTVPLIPPNQKAVIAMPGHAFRKAKFAEARKTGKREGLLDRSNLWRQSMPVTFRWKCTASEKGPFIVTLSEKKDFKDPKIFSSRKKTELTPENYELNLKPGRTYYWRVAANAGKTASGVSSFTTETHPPRWIMSEGKTGNIRDLGGWKTGDGATVRQGVLFRGEAMNQVSADGIHAGRSRLMAEDIAMFRRELGLKTDLDLRRSAETGALAVSPLGKEVKLVRIPTPSYWDIFSPGGRKCIAADFRLLADPGNHPVYFHCQAGKDRTGTLAFILNGVLGVPEKDLAADYELSLLPWMPEAGEKDNFEAMVKGFDKYGAPGEPLETRIGKYLLECGITPKEIDAFRKMMLVK